MNYPPKKIRRWRHMSPILAIVFASPYGLSQDSEVSDDEVFELSPFEVTSEENEGYRATSSLAGSRLKSSLKDLASPVSVVTEEFLQDTASTDLEDILVYQTNSEVAGLGGNFYGTNADDGGYRNEMLVNPQRGTRLRGLNSADITRNYYRSNIPTNAYNTSRVDISRGPNSILFGLGSPAGIINSSAKDPYMSEAGGALEIGFDSYGSRRAVVDVSKPLIEDVLAVRFIAMDDESKFRQDHTFNDDSRFYGSLKWQPKVADGMFTQFDLRGEIGSINANRPVATTAADFASNWWEVGQRLMYEPERSNSVPQDPDLTQHPELSHYFSGAPARGWWNQTPATIFQDPNSSRVGNGSIDAYRQRGGGSPWGGLSGVSNSNWDEGGTGVWNRNTASYYSGNPVVSSLISQFETETGQSFSGFGSGLWPTQMILDGPLAFIDQPIQGPNKSEYNDFDSIELGLTQTFLNGDLGFNLGYYDESYDSGYTNAINTNRVTVDVNAVLRAGYDNPDTGRPAVYGPSAGNDSSNTFTTYRAQGFYKFQPGELFNSDFIAKLFGEQTFTAVYSDERATSFGANFNLYGWDPATYNQPYNGSSNVLGSWSVHYLGDDLSGFSSFDSIPSSAIHGINAVQDPGVSNQVLSYDGQGANSYRAGTASLLSHLDDKDNLYTSATGGRTSTKSKSVVWQGKLLNDAILPMFGWREDEYQAWNKPTPTAANGAFNSETGTYSPFAPTWNYDGIDPIITAKEQRRSWGVVVHADKILDMFGTDMPKGTELSLFYNDSNSFRPADLGIDNYGKPLDYPSGETQDYGFRLGMFDGKLELRTTWYETTQKNTTISDATGMIWWTKAAIVRAVDGLAQETWGAGPFVDQPIPEWLVNNWFLGDGNYDQSVMNQPIPADWRDQLGTLVNQPLRIRAGAVPGSANYIAQGDINPESGFAYLGPQVTPEEIEYRTAWFAARSHDEWFRPLDPAWVAAKEFEYIGTDWYLWEQNPPPGQLLTNDLKSEGVEIEITANPTERWRMSFNASKNEASRTNILPDWPEFIEAMKPIWFDGFNDNPSEVAALNYWTIDGYSDIRAWPGAGPSYSGFVETLGGRMLNAVYAPYLNLIAGEGQGVSELRKWRFNFVTNYQFADEGKFAGFNVGGAVRWQDKAAIGYYPKFNAEADSWVTDVSNPIFADGETNYDAWVGYQRKLNDKLDYRVQLNVRNLFADDKLIPIAANPDGTVAQARIPSKTTWTVSNTISF